jgi:crotonobetainyl-CoA:carnitine CoA-transferase CaiB-like acyl-CoA transferase
MPRGKSDHCAPMPAITASPALSRLRILDLTRVRAGPTCVRQFADFGADVIKVENTTPEDMGGTRDGPDFQNLHRNKRSMTLNLKDPRGLAIFMTMVEVADVVVENYRPDVKFRLGVDYESLKKVNRRVILASISGFGQDGPYASRPGFDQIAQGMGGLMMVTGKPGEGPMRAGAAVADMTAGFLAAIGLLTALHEREVSGEGQWVQSNLLQAQIALMDFQAARYLMKGEIAPQVGNDHPVGMPTSAYRTRDGYLNINTLGQPAWMRLCKALGRESLIDDPRFKAGPDRARNRRDLNAVMDELFSQRSTEEWIPILLKADIACGPIYTMDQVFADPQVQHLHAAASVNHPVLGDIRVVNQPVTLSRTPASMVRATPEPGEHTNEILGELGYSAEEIKSLRADKVV